MASSGIETKPFSYLSSQTPLSLRNRKNEDDHLYDIYVSVFVDHEAQGVEEQFVGACPMLSCLAQCAQCGVSRGDASLDDKVLAIYTISTLGVPTFELLHQSLQTESRSWRSSVT